MKLAEALHLRADLQKRIAQLKTRLINNSKVQEGDCPAENPEELLKELNENIIELQRLISCINHTNCETEENGISLTQMIARKDALGLKLAVLRDFLASASEKVERYSNKEIRIQSTVDVRVLQKQIDELSKELRLLDVKLQGLNWTTDLLE